MSKLTPNYLGPDPRKWAASTALAMVSKHFGIGSLISIWYWYVAAPAALVAIVTGIIATILIRKGEAAGADKAATGVVCGIVPLALYTVLVLCGVHLILGKAI